jgi:CRISPR-associated exonuclease Cas4
LTIAVQMTAASMDDPIPISALNHYAYCPRRCALIHVEQIFEENVYTLRGRSLHERVDEPIGEFQEGVRIERALPLWSVQWGLIGKADVVEFRKDSVVPIEYKSGRLREFDNDELQLCAQGICLEEMTGKPVPLGVIYHHGSRRRREVELTEKLRAEVERAVFEIRKMLTEKMIPPPVNDSRCGHCSLKESCMPAVVGEKARAAALLRDLFVPF